MFGTIRKHQTWLWVVIIVVIIISFVVYFSPYSNLNTEVRTVDYGAINGEKVNKEEFARAQREVYLRYFMMSGRWPDNDAQRMGFDLDRETYEWLLIQQKADELGIEAGQELVDEQARQMVQQMQQLGINSADMLFKQVLAPKGLSPQDFERLVANFVRTRQLVATIGVSGKLVTPEEIKALYRRENQEVATEAAIFHGSNYLSKVTVTPEAVARFYTNRLANYRIPDRVQVSYVKFDLSNFLAAAETELGTNLNELVEANLARLGTNLNRVANTPEEARVRIREEVLKSRALPEARRKASEFASPLFDAQTVTAASMEEAATKQGLPVKVTPPFTRDGAPEGLAVGPEFAKAAFALNPEDPISRPLVENDGVYLLALKNRIPSEVPPLDQVRAKVEQDYKESEALNLARQAGGQFQAAASNAVAQGKSFEAVAKENNVQTTKLPPFSLRTQNLPAAEANVNLNQLKQLAFGTDPGQVSQFQPTAEGGLVLFVREKLPVDETRMASSLPAYANMVRQSRQEEAFNDWFRKEREKAFRDVPLFQQQRQPPPTMTSRNS